MSGELSMRALELRSLIDDFLEQRKAEKLKGKASTAEVKDRYTREVWLASAAARVAQIAMVTHAIKGTHPDARGSSVSVTPSMLAPVPYLGSHVLQNGFIQDVVGNAAALDIVKFLRLQHNGRSILDLATGRDPDLAAALTNDHHKSEEWIDAFAGILRPDPHVSSHPLVKQVYWFTGTDPMERDAFHLLSPLYPTSLVHEVYQRISDARFGEGSKLARDARKRGLWHPDPLREFPNLAVQKLGGSNTQNVSQLNSQRRGVNYLLASLPPHWQERPVSPPIGVASLFTAYGRRTPVRECVAELLSFLRQDPAPNVATRQRRQALVGRLIDEFVRYTFALRAIPRAWCEDPRCRLPAMHIRWATGDITSEVYESVFGRLAADFARWLNAALRRRLPVGDAEFVEWRRVAEEEFRTFHFTLVEL